MDETSSQLKVIDLEVAKTLAADMFREEGCLSDVVLYRLLDLLDDMAGGSNKLVLNEALVAIRNCLQAVELGDGSMLVQPRGMRVDRVVDIQEFVESKTFMGQRGSVRPAVMEKLWELFHGDGCESYLEAVLAGAIGWGKSYFSEMGMGYLLYKLSCFHCPQIEFGLAPGSTIVFIMQSIKLELAKKVLFQQFGQRVKDSPYFTRFFPYDPRVSAEMRFPNNVMLIPISSSDTAALGLNVFGGCFPGHQEYVLGDGSLAKLGDCRTESVLTVKDPESFPLTYQESKVRSILTGYKELIRVHLSNGTSIECTPDQRFKGENGEWIRAEDLTGARVLFADLPIVRSQGDVLGTAPKVGPRGDDGQRVSADVSGGTSVWEEDVRHAASGQSDCRVSSLRTETVLHQCQTPEVSWSDCAAVSGEISEGRIDARTAETSLVCQVQSTCDEAESGSAVQEGVEARNGQSGSLGKRGTAGVAEGSGVPETYVCGGETSLRNYVGHKEASCVGAVCRRTPGGKDFSQEECGLHGSQGTCVQDVVQTGVSDRVLVGQDRPGLGVRGREDSIHGWKAPLCSGFHVADIEHVPGEQGAMACGQGLKMAREAKDASGQAVDLLRSGGEEVRIESGSKLDGQDQNPGDRLLSSELTLCVVTCDRVERLGVVVPVYDLEHVPDTHTFFVKAGSGFLLAHNCLDELNFMARIEKSTRSKFTGEEEYDQAEKLYSTILRRMKSRFNVLGRVPGKVFLVSSANYPGDFTDRKIQEREQQLAETGRTGIFLAKMSQWEALPKDRLSTEKFYVEVGDAARRSRLLPSPDDAVDPASVLEVPVDYLDDFKRDLEGAIRDLAGIPVGGSNSFIKQREQIVKAAEMHHQTFKGHQLFKVGAADISRFSNDFSVLFDEEYLEMIEDPLASFVAHVDLALTGDSCGVAIGHCAGFKHVGKSMNWDEKSKRYLEDPGGAFPIILIDGVLEIVPPLSDEIDITFVGDLLEAIASRVNLTMVTADSFQSAQMLQRLRKVRNLKGRSIKAGMLSVDVDLAPYAYVKQGLRDERLFYPKVERLMKELRELALDPIKLKVDHPPTGSKDVSDGVAGVTHVLMRTTSHKGAKAEAKEPELPGVYTQGEGRPRRTAGRRRVHG